MTAFQLKLDKQIDCFACFRFCILKGDGKLLCPVVSCLTLTFAGRKEDKFRSLPENSPDKRRIDCRLVWSSGAEFNREIQRNITLNRVISE